MKTAIKALVAIAVSCGAFAAAQESKKSDDTIVSVLQPTPSVQRVVVQDPVEPIMEPSTPAEIILQGPMATDCCTNCCCEPRRCCCPATIPTTFCLVDPCGCSHEACVEVPVCCAGESPVISWRDGIFGRQIATLCWSCCDEEIRVIVTHSGKVKVRD